MGGFTEWMSGFSHVADAARTREHWPGWFFDLGICPSISVHTIQPARVRDRRRSEAVPTDDRPYPPCGTRRSRPHGWRTAVGMSEHRRRQRCG